jgi:hypothetical protein
MPNNLLIKNLDSKDCFLVEEVEWKQAHISQSFFSKWRKKKRQNVDIVKDVVAIPFLTPSDLSMLAKMDNVLQEERNEFFSRIENMYQQERFMIQQHFQKKVLFECFCTTSRHHTHWAKPSMIPRDVWKMIQDFCEYTIDRPWDFPTILYVVFIVI